MPESTPETTKRKHCPTCETETEVYTDGTCSECLMNTGSAFGKEEKKKQGELF